MKTKYCLWFLIALVSIVSCKKENLISKKLSASSTSNIASDGVVTIQASILPPVTQQRFIANGSESIAQFQVVATQHIFIYSTSFTATYPFIQGLLVNDNYANNNNGGCYTTPLGYIYGDQGGVIETKAIYLPVDSTTSGTIVKLSFLNFEYRTDDEVYHSLFLGKSIPAQDMCLVNNVPHLLFQNPKFDTLKNGYVEIAEVKLSGDTDWVLNSLPLSVSVFDAPIPKSELIVKSQGIKIATKSDSIQADYNFPGQTVINFKNGFRHVAGKSEIIKIYSALGYSHSPRVTFTKLYPVSSFEWTDGLGAFISGAKNGKFFKEYSGQSEFGYPSN